MYTTRYTHYIALSYKQNSSCSIPSRPGHTKFEGGGTIELSGKDGLPATRVSALEANAFVESSITSLACDFHFEPSISVADRPKGCVESFRLLRVGYKPLSCWNYCSTCTSSVHRKNAYHTPHKHKEYIVDGGLITLMHYSH